MPSFPHLGFRLGYNFTKTAEAGKEIDLSYYSTNGDNVTISMVVKDGEGKEVATVTNNKYKFTKAGTYTIVITASDTEGNTDTQTVTITVAKHESNCSTVEMPNSNNMFVWFIGITFIGLIGVLVKKSKNRTESK